MSDVIISSRTIIESFRGRLPLLGALQSLWRHMHHSKPVSSLAILPVFDVFPVHSIPEVSLVLRFIHQHLNSNVCSS